MLARQVVPLTSSESFHPTQLPSRQQPTAVNPLAATLMELPTSVANKRLTPGLSPLHATLTKNRGWGVLLLTSSLCFPTFKRACKRPLFSIASTLFHFPYPVTPLLACPPWRDTLTKTARCVPTIPILELRPGRLPLSKSAPLHLPPVTSHDSPVTSRPSPCPKRNRPAPPPLCI